jgi:predicted nucleotidyltransferase
MFKELDSLKVFFEEPAREFNIREIARVLKISPATASKELKDFDKKGVLKRRTERIFELYSANLESEFYRDLKIFYNIRKIKDSGLIGEINKFYLKPAIILFGSCAYGLDTETSDLDILIISEKTKELPNSLLFEKKLNRKVQMFVVKNVKDLKNKHLINNVLNGIVLQGEVKWT